MKGNREVLSSGTFAILLAIACVVGLLHLRQALSGVETPAAEDVLQGKWSKQFEKTFRESLPVSVDSRDLWGRIEYSLFKEGRKGVIVGTDGWLFTDEEFSCPAHNEQNLAENLAYTAVVQKTLAQKNARLVVVLVPAKARILLEHLGKNGLPACRRKLYANIRSSFIRSGIPVTDLLPIMLLSPEREKLYLKTDTHWSPLGAKLAAQETAQLVHMLFRDNPLPQSRFDSRAGGEKYITGDLTGYLPGVAFPQDKIAYYISGTTIASAQTQQSLFDDTTPPVTLVGTSYSANPNWNFEGFLKETLNTDVLNMADQGLGPFVVMDKYLQNDSWKNAPPRLVVWEIPERYLLMPHGVSAP